MLEGNSWCKWPFKKTGYNTKITKIEGKIPSITALATTPALNAIENKIPDVSNLF